MAIYKLGDICEIISGKKPITSYGKIKVVGSGGHFGYTSNYITKKSSIVLPRKGSMIIHWFDEPIWNVDTAFVISNVDETLVLKKFLYYSLISNYCDWRKIVKWETTRQATKITDWRKLSINLPKINEQQKIIDIIEPIEWLFIKYPNTIDLSSYENCKKDVQKIIDIIEPIEKLIENVKNIKNKIISMEKNLILNPTFTDTKFNYEKGFLPNKEGDEKTPFLNVSAANGKINRFVSNEPNIFIGDVTLSLDGNCGLVNNSLEGFNGYLYKVSIPGIENWQVYYSLKTNESQRIIKMNETGTTIMHSPNSKKQLTLAKFDNEDCLKSLFDMNIKIDLMNKKMNQLKDNMIKLLIK